MCGIVGGVGKNEWPSKALIEKIAHRGPDASGVFIEEALFLGHTRLSIQDLSEHGNQPMSDETANYVIIFNGEIYNHLEIRKSLLAKGYTFRSTGDTETLLYGYIEYGPEILDQLNGIFSFAIYAKDTRKLFVARDHFGVKPLYYHYKNGLFFFSSELKAINGLIDFKLDEQALANYLTFLWSPGSLTPHKEIKKLLPGSSLTYDLGSQELTEKKYFDLKIPIKYQYSDEAEAVEELDRLLRQAVKRQMLSDVPVGFFLSGGLDSSLLVAIAKSLYPSQSFECFTINSKLDAKTEGFTDDLGYAKLVAKTLDVNLHIVDGSTEILNSFDHMIWHLDEPQADPSPLHVFSIAQAAKAKGIKVLIGGTAGDDVFSGYRRHQALNLERYYRVIPNVFFKVFHRLAQGLNSNNPTIRRLKKLISNAKRSKDERLVGYFEWLPFEAVKGLFIGKKISSPINSLAEIISKADPEADLLNKMLYLEKKTFLVDHNLNYTDKMSMAAGVETRVPFLDRDLVSFSEALDPSLKLNGYETKYILKKVAERYLPHEVIYRAKTGFGSPVREWINHELTPMINDYLSIEAIEQRGVFDSEAVQKLIVDNRTGKIDAAYPIWSLLAIESWMRQFVDKHETNHTKP